MRGCGKLTNVEGTNGGKMPCGSNLTDLKGDTSAYFCAVCDPTPTFQLGQMVKAVAFTDCFKKDHSEVPNLIVTEMRLIEDGLPPYWRIKAEAIDPKDHGYIEGAEGFFAHQIEVQS